MIRAEIEKALSETNALLVDVVDELEKAQDRLEKNPTGANVDAVASLQGKKASLESTISRLEANLSKADQETLKQKNVGKVDAFEAALPENIATLRKKTADFVKTMKSAKEQGQELEKEFESFSDASLEQIDYEGFIGCSKR